MGDSLNAVDDWAGEIVDGVDPAEGEREGVSKANLAGSKKCQFVSSWEPYSLSGEQGGCPLCASENGMPNLESKPSLTRPSS